MLRISDEALDYWGDLFVCHNLGRYLTFHQFIAAPEENLQKILNGVLQPRPAQSPSTSRVESTCASLDRALDELAAQVELQVVHLRRIANGHYYEPLKHRAHPR